MPDEGPFHFLVIPWPRYFTVFDLLVNVFAYIPLSILFFDLARRHLKWSSAVVITCLTGCLLSFSMETLQGFLPVRISSPFDFLANSFGTVIGAFLGPRMGHSWLIRWLVDWRHRTFSESLGSEFGEVLLAIWLFIQLNPSIPFFAAGTITSPNSTEWNVSLSQPLSLLPQGLAVALNLCGFGLFASVLLKPSVRALRFVISVIAVGVFLKMLAAGALLKPPMMLDWFGKDTFVGLVGGFVLLWATTRLSHRWRVYLAAMTILAGGLLAKIAAIYDTLSTIRSVFSWSHGQLLNFTSLTVALNELWPVVALVYLLIGFNRLPSSDVSAS